jgi:hypothetical protein
VPGVDATVVRPTTALVLGALRVVLGPSPVVTEARARVLG